LNKKGDVSLLFKWIFGIIAGAVILMFLFKFAGIHIGGEQALEGNKFLVSVDDKLDAFGIGEGSDIFDLKDEFLLGVQCGEFSVNEETSENYFARETDKVVFAPSSLKGDNLHVWTKKWYFPYGVTMFFYLNNPQNRILIVSDANKIEEVGNFVKKIPQHFSVQVTTKQLFNPASFSSQAKGSDKITVVFFGTSTYSVNDLKSQYGNNLNIEIIQVNLEDNTAKIYDNYGGVEDVFFLGDEMLYGLIFSGSGYECTKDIALNRLNTLTRIYIEKVNRLAGKTSETKCVDSLVQSRILLEKYSTTLTKNEFYSLMEQIEKQNNKLEKEGCTTIY